MVWAFETWKPRPSDMPLPTSLHLLILHKHFHQLWTKISIKYVRLWVAFSFSWKRKLQPYWESEFISAYSYKNLVIAETCACNLLMCVGAQRRDYWGFLAPSITPSSVDHDRADIYLWPLCAWGTQPAHTCVSKPHIHPKMIIVSCRLL